MGSGGIGVRAHLVISEALFDLEDPATYGSANNRLMYYETFDTSGGYDLASTTWYYYNDVGNVTRVVTHEEGTQDYSATRLGYAVNGQAVVFMVNETWQWDGESSCDVPGTYDITHAREFRYEGPRQRYLNRRLDPAALLNEQIVALNETWSDYDGDEIYADYTIAPGGAVTEQSSHEPGIAQKENGGGTFYYHADMLGSTRYLSSSFGAGVQEAGYLAFGEHRFGVEHRFGYAGAWGYQAHGSFPFLHVGHRYYDPTTGRFLQRDPIGIEGGTKVYTYVRNNPVASVDPDGLQAKPPKTDNPRYRDVGGNDNSHLPPMGTDPREWRRKARNFADSAWDFLKRPALVCGNAITPKLPKGMGPNYMVPPSDGAGHYFEV